MLTGKALSLVRRLVGGNPALLGMGKKLYARYLYHALNWRKFDMPVRLDGKSRLIADMTCLSNADAGTGIQRVSRNLFIALSAICANRHDVLPVYATAEKKGYFIARPLEGCGVKMFRRTTEPLAVRQGDVFVGLDHAPDVVLAHLPVLRAMRERGVEFYFFVHDNLPVSHPQWFSPGTGDLHAAWLKEIAFFAHLLCVSQTVRDDVERRLTDMGRPIPAERLHWLHNGVSLDNFRLPANKHLMDNMRHPIFLIVSTVEPRKGHAQALAAFELLWSRGVDATLVVAGRRGWQMEDLEKRFVNHPEAGKRLFRLISCGDAEIGALYAGSDCVLSPSLAEGFGLSLVEGAVFGKPLLLRDLPVFREIAGTSAFYFHGEQPEDLACAVEEWLKAWRQGAAPDSSAIEINDWDACAEKLFNMIYEPARGQDFTRATQLHADS